MVGGYAAWAVEETVGGGEEFDVVCVALDLGDETDGAEDSVEGVADVFEFGVEFIAAMLEPVLETFEQIGREVGAIAVMGLWKIWSHWEKTRLEVMTTLRRSYRSARKVNKTSISSRLCWT